MNILVIGGTRYMGVHLVNYLLGDGHKVTIATRGTTPDNFGNSINRLILDRTNPDSIAEVLSDRRFDVVYDSLAYSSNEIKYLHDVLKCNRYIETSTMSVYEDLYENITENDFDPVSYPLKWCSRSDYEYDEIKRQAECAIFQTFKHVPSVAVRFPYVIGEDDYTKRLYFYVEHIVKSISMLVDNIDSQIAFINSSEAGKFLSWLAKSDYCGSINAGSYGNIALSEIITYVENKTSINAVYSDNGDPAPYNGAPSFSLDLSRVESIGFRFSHLDSWIYSLLDAYIEQAKRS